MPQAQSGQGQSRAYSQGQQGQGRSQGQQGQQQGQQGRQAQQGQGRGNGYGRAQAATFNVAAIATRGIGQLYDMQIAAARMMLQTQARAATAFGLPDYSDLFRVADDRAKHVFSSSTEHLLNVAQQAREAITEVQHHVGRLVECNTVTVSETWQQELDEFSNQAEQGLTQLKELARQEAEEAVKASEMIAQETRQMIRESGEESRRAMSEGMGQMRQQMGQQGQEAEGEQQGEESQAEEGEEEGTSKSRRGRRG